jgi:hypothetical protein
LIIVFVFVLFYFKMTYTYFRPSASSHPQTKCSQDHVHGYLQEETSTPCKRDEQCPDSNVHLENHAMQKYPVILQTAGLLLTSDQNCKHSFFNFQPPGPPSTIIGHYQIRTQCPLPTGTSWSGLNHFFSTPSIRPGASIRRGAISCWLPSHYRTMKMICILAPQKLSGIINLHDNYIVDKSNRKSLLRACRCCVFVAVYLRTPIAIIFKYNACTIFVCIK